MQDIQQVRSICSARNNKDFLLFLSHSLSNVGGYGGFAFFLIVGCKKNNLALGFVLEIADVGSELLYGFTEIEADACCSCEHTFFAS